MTDFDAVKQLVFESLAAMEAMPEEPYRNAKSIFPQVWCEYASTAIAELLEQRGFGTWDFISAGEAEGMSGHAWLELRDQEGVLVFTIDATLHQFGEWDDPYLGPDPSPAYKRFPVPRYVGPWKDWPELERNQSYERYVLLFLEYMSSWSEVTDEVAAGQAGGFDGSP